MGESAKWMEADLYATTRYNLAIEETRWSNCFETRMLVSFFTGTGKA